MQLGRCVLRLPLSVLLQPECTPGHMTPTPQGKG